MAAAAAADSWVEFREQEGTSMLSQTDAKKAIVILSGGLDSTVCMGVALKQGYQIHPLTFDYGQRHRIELEAAKQVSEHYGTMDSHLWINLEKILQGSSLTDDNLEVPMHRDTDNNQGIPNTYVPARNIIFLSMAASLAESLGAEAIFIGVNALDYSGYPDCRPKFIEAFQQTINLGTAAGAEGKGIEIKTPLLNLSKAGIVKLGLELKVPLHLTRSCYIGQDEACGHCDSCQLRLKGFAEAGTADPIAYAGDKK